MFIHFSGRDGHGWSIDQDFLNMSRACKLAGHTIVRRPWMARITHSLWWNSFVNSPTHFWHRNSRVLLTCSNFVDPEDPTFSFHDEWNKAKELGCSWIAPSLAQKNILEKFDCKVKYLPFFIDFELFAETGKYASREDLFRRFSIPPQVVSGRKVLGSFQRDSLGADLRKPKWQKGPEYLIDVLSEMPKDKFILLLAGPRRHFIIRSCKERNIPYFYVGNETQEDDLVSNMLPIAELPYLYRMLDAYLVTSSSEGGPKAILEATATSTLCLSTRVGLSEDYLDESFVFHSKKDYASYLYNFLSTDSYPQEVVDNCFLNCKKTQNLDAQANALSQIYADL